MQELQHEEQTVEALAHQLDEMRKVLSLTLNLNKLEDLITLRNYGYFSRGDGTYGAYKPEYPVYPVLVRQIKSLSKEIENEINMCKVEAENERND